MRRQERSAGAASSKFQNVYVKNLGEDVTEERLKEVFEEFGKTTSAVIMKVRRWGVCSLTCHWYAQATKSF